MRLRPFVASVAVSVSLVLALGCGGNPPAPVSGTVTLDGRALPDALVSFQPLREGDNVNPGPGSAARTGADGKYSLQISVTGQNGAVVGKHRVEIRAFTGNKQGEPGG